MKVKDYMNQGLEPGLYKFSLLDIDAEGTTLKGDRMIAIKWEEVNEGAVVWDNIAVSKSAAWKLAQLWVAFGGDEEDEVGDPDEFGDKLILRINDVKEVYAVTNKSTYQGVTRSKISEYKTAEVGEKLIGKQEVSGVTF